jgi:DNA-binding beta-propeller fold protein YncE
MTTVSAANTQAPRAVAIDQTRNKIYVANLGAGGVCPAELMGDCNPGSITLIDGATNATTLLIDPKANAPRALVVDSVTDRVYVANLGSSNLSVIGGDVIPTTHALAVIFTGASGGSATSHPAGIDCGPSTSTSGASTACAASFPAGSPVTLTAGPLAGTVLSAWSEPCAGTGSCQVTMNADQFVMATFQTPVPNVVGLSFGAADAAIERAGLTLGAETQRQSNGVAPRTVLGESPAAGTPAAPGTAVNLVVSAYSTVPDVTGQPSGTAVSALTASGLAAGNVTSQTSSSVPSGDVISESPAAGSVVAPSSSVNLVVSSGAPATGSSGGGGGGTIGLGDLLWMLCYGLGRAFRRLPRGCSTTRWTAAGERSAHAPMDDEGCEKLASLLRDVLVNSA